MIAGQAATGSGIGPSSIDFVLGIVKAYTTELEKVLFPQNYMTTMVSVLEKGVMNLALRQDVSVGVGGLMLYWYGKRVQLLV